jgi:hypothetical protein
MIDGNGVKAMPGKITDKKERKGNQSGHTTKNDFIQ